MKICKNCNIEKSLEEYHKKKGGYLGCRPICKQCVCKQRRDAYQPKDKVKRTPWNKGKRTPEDVRKKQSLAAIGRKHSKETCEKMSQSRRGRSRTRQSWNFKQWRSKVFERDGHTCQKCGAKDRLHPHHIIPFEESDQLRFDTSNGVTLCASCHGKLEGFQKGHSSWNKGRSPSEETRKKISESLKLYYSRENSKCR